MPGGTTQRAGCTPHTGRMNAVCAPLLGADLLREPLTARQASDLAVVLKAIADPMRLRILSIAAAREGGEVCTCELTEPLGLRQPTISHHLKVLVDAGILTGDKRGKWTYYAVNFPALDALSAVLGPRSGKQDS